MCGICGVAWWTNPPFPLPKLRAMRDRMLSRGPDDCGEWVGRSAALSHRRLAVIDVTATGHQPMSNEDGSIQVTYNGEVYNYRELGAELEAKGHVFRSTSDTEVLVHGYESWGLDQLCRKLQGMFAFGLWDARRQVLCLARDRIGKKPLFYTRQHGHALFASTLNALRLGIDSVDYDLEALAAYLDLGYVPQELCALRGVRKVQASEHITFTEQDQLTATYWTPRYDEDRSKSVNEWMDAVGTRMEDAVRRRLVSDVPLGAFLSGGVDSSYVVALGVRHTPRLRTFSMKPDFEEYDESPYYTSVAARCETDHTELSLAEGDVSCFDAVADEYGEPFADSSAIPTYLLSKLTRRFVTVALSGDGGDEVFAGYPTHTLATHMGRWRKIVPLQARSVLTRLLAASTNAVLPGSQLAQKAATLRTFLAGRDIDALSYKTLLPLEFQDTLFGPKLADLVSSRPHLRIIRRHWKEAPSDDFLKRLLYVGMKTNLVGKMLVKVDVASMAWSLEIRCPFLDHQVVELAAAIPSERLLCGSQSKGLLKACAARHLPSHAIYRRKRGFGIPVFKWLPPTTAARRLGRRRVVDHGLINGKGLQRLQERYDADPRRYHVPMYVILVLERWLRQLAE